MSKTKAVMQPRFAHISLLLVIFLLASSCSPQVQEHDGAGALHESFIRCVARLSPATADPSRLVHAPSEASYPSLLNATIQNLRFASPRTPRPALLLTPATVAEARACVACCRRHGLTVRARSGGHDYEGLSYRSVGPPAAGARGRPFAVVDVAALRDVRVDAARREARVGPGATLGELYYAVARKSGGALGFPAGICPTVCVGGHLSGGGFGPMMRKHGLAADNVVGAEVVDAEGRLLDRARGPLLGAPPRRRRQLRRHGFLDGAPGPRATRRVRLHRSPPRPVRRPSPSDGPPAGRRRRRKRVGKAGETAQDRRCI